MATPAGEKTEKPTARRLKDAREKGEVARSRDLSSALSLFAVTMALGWFGSGLFGAVRDRLVAALRGLGDHPLAAVASTDLSTMVWADLWRCTATAGPLLLLAGLVSTAASIAQVGWAIAPKALELHWDRLNPASGSKRLLPKQAVPDLLKAMIGTAVLGAICYAFVRQCFDRAPLLTEMTPATAVQAGWSELSTLLWRACITLLGLAGADYALQRWRWYDQVKMTKQELREDARKEGSPEVKARVRKVQKEMTRRRMLQAVKKATVVITNPTHFAVAIEYRRREMVAPLVVAKGQDLLAARIRKIARDHGVPIVENVTLARALYKGAEVGDTIPASLFGAVAEVLAYLVRLKQLVL